MDADIRIGLTIWLKKGVMISHRNVIANVLQIAAFEKSWRDKQKTADGNYYTDVLLGLLPQSHIYGLVVMCHAGPFRGDQVIVLPKFELGTYMAAVQNFKISTLFVVSKAWFPRLVPALTSCRCHQSLSTCFGVGNSAANTTLAPRGRSSLARRPSVKKLLSTSRRHIRMSQSDRHMVGDFLR